MKKYIPYISVILLFFTLDLAAQDDEIDNVRLALRTGNSKELVKYFHDPATVELNGERVKYSRSQAENVMKQFFMDFPPSSFQINHQGASTNDTPYVIGQYNHEEGDYRVLIKFRKYEPGFLVDLIIFYKN